MLYLNLLYSNLNQLKNDYLLYYNEKSYRITIKIAKYHIHQTNDIKQLKNIDKKDL